MNVSFCHEDSSFPTRMYRRMYGNGAVTVPVKHGKTVVVCRMWFRRLLSYGIERILPKEGIPLITSILGCIQNGRFALDAVLSLS